MIKEVLTALDWMPSDPERLPCACCGGMPSLWEVDREGHITKMVNCDTTWENEDSIVDDMCPLYSPPGMAFNKATRREAVQFWNQFQTRLIEQRNANAHKEAT